MSEQVINGVVDARKVLEEFVVNNDELLELEELIGRFNIFDALGIVRKELQHSNFLAWLLDPAESHGQGSLFLSAILMDLLRKSPPELRPFSPVELDGAELRGVEVRREWHRIDILITCDEPRFVIAIENKVDSTEHSDQLKRYRDVVEEHFPNTPRQFVYLTIAGDEPSRAAWVPYSYADVHRVLQSVRTANTTSVGGEVLAFLDHYLNLIRSRFMGDPEIERLCKAIYRNHRQAIQLITEHVGDFADLMSEVRDAIESVEGLEVVWESKGEIHAVPEGWARELPRIGSDSRAEPASWMRFLVLLNRQEKTLSLTFHACPTTDPPFRRKAVSRLTQNAEEFGLSTSRTKIGDQWTQLYKVDLLRGIDLDDEDSSTKLREATVRHSQTLLRRVAGIPGAINALSDDQHAAGHAPT